MGTGARAAEADRLHAAAGDPVREERPDLNGKPVRSRRCPRNGQREKIRSRCHWSPGSGKATRSAGSPERVTPALASPDTGLKHAHWHRGGRRPDDTGLHRSPCRTGPGPVPSDPARCRQRFSRDSRTGRAADRHDDTDSFRADRPPLPRAAGQRAGLRPGQDHGDGRAGPPLAPPGPAGAGVQDRPRLHRSDGARARQRRAVPAARPVDGRRGPLPRAAVAGRRRGRPDPGRGRDGPA